MTRDKDQALAEVVARRCCLPYRRQVPSSGTVIEQLRKDGRTVKAQRAVPDDAALEIDQRRRARVGQEAKLADGNAR